MGNITINQEKIKENNVNSESIEYYDESNIIYKFKKLERHSIDVTQKKHKEEQ